MIVFVLPGATDCAKKIGDPKAAKFREETSKKTRGDASRRTGCSTGGPGINLNLCNAAKRGEQCCGFATPLPRPGAIGLFAPVESMAFPPLISALARMFIGCGLAARPWPKGYSFHGFRSGTPVVSKSTTLRVTTVKPCTSAVAAISPSR